MNFFWISLYQGKYRDFLESIKNPTQKTLVFTPNPEIFVHASRDSEFLDILAKATHNTPDGTGLYVGSMMSEWISFFVSGIRAFFTKKQVELRYGELIKWSDLTRDLFDFASLNKKHILIIDSYRVTEPQNEFEIRKKEIQWNLKNLLSEKFPKLKFTVIFDKDHSPQEIAKLIEQENISYVFSCLGMKKQEERLVQIWDFLPEITPVVWLWVGASIDFLLGLQKRAPYLFQKFWLEWLYRLILEPRKRWKRIQTALIEFPEIIKKNNKIRKFD
jgi:N-acetylglucosaminyldiphosphoundecaprenol N-acetyl-beta-D-mannosaminyltransferase